MQKKRSPGEASVEKSASSTAPSTDGGAKRRKIQLHSELSAALEEAVKEIGQLKTELKRDPLGSSKAYVLTWERLCAALTIQMW